MDGGETTVQWKHFWNPPQAGGLHANSLINIAKNPSCNEVNF